MRRVFQVVSAVLLVFLSCVGLFAQQKYALVIGNGNYTSIGKLNNPVNDANDVSTALQGLGFTVDKVLDANLDQMESAIMRLKNRLSVSNGSYGFFFYAGHGVQSGGENYLIPVGASIPSENSLRERAISVQWALAELNEAKNALNVVVLDACRDNPFAWKRSGTRGLSVVGNQPADSIIVYATSAGSTAADGTGRNGLFTTYMLNNLKTPGLEVKEVFNRTGADVSRASNRTQIPAVYNQFFDTAYLGSLPQTTTTTVTPQPAPSPAPVVQPTSTVQPTLQPAAISPNKTFFDGNGHSYEVIKEKKPWTNAKKDCEERGGYLATITSSEEQKFIEGLLPKNGYYWLGGYYEGKKWRWVTGEPFTYTNWLPGEPNNYEGSEDKLGLKPRKWNDFVNSDKDVNGYICEWD